MVFIKLGLLHVCVLSHRFTVGDLSLSFIIPPKVSPLQARGFSTFVTYMKCLEALEAVCLQGV